MKKIFLILILFLFLCVEVHADDSFIPQWSEFCPVKYLNAEQMEYMTTSSWKNILCIVSLLGIKYRIQYVKTNNYWVDRKNSFENEIGLCNENESNDDKISCYMKVRQLEVEKNHQLEEERIARQQLQTDQELLYSQMQEVRELYRINNNR